MKADFEKAIEYVTQNEGGFVDNPNDPGLATKYGISLHMLSISRKGAVTINDVLNLSLDEAKQIYKNYFWNPMQLDLFSHPIATALFDMAVNMGQKRCVELAQLAMGYASADGILGPQTVSKLVVASPEEFLYNFIVEIKKHYVDIVKAKPEEIVFLDGWLKRAIRLFLLNENH